MSRIGGLIAPGSSPLSLDLDGSRGEFWVAGLSKSGQLFCQRLDLLASVVIGPPSGVAPHRQHSFLEEDSGWFEAEEGVFGDDRHPIARRNKCLSDPARVRFNNVGHR